jgi:hypothetical protein
MGLLAVLVDTTVGSLTGATGTAGATGFFRILSDFERIFAFKIEILEFSRKECIGNKVIV